MRRFKPSDAVRHSSHRVAGHGQIVVRLQVDPALCIRAEESSQTQGCIRSDAAHDLAGHWAVTVNGNWRMTFVFDGVDAELVDYLDYH